MPPIVLTAGLNEAANVLREAVNRVVAAPEVAGTFAGTRRPKKLRVRIAILRDESGAPVATEAEVQPALDEAKRVLREQAGVELLPADGRWLETLTENGPREALDSPCAEGSWQADFGPGGAFFRRHRVRTTRGTLTGSAAPITAFVVRDVLGKAGCSLGPLVDYVTIDRRAFEGRTLRVLAHELGHACGLPHSSEAENLMLPARMGERLKTWQVAVLRSSRHVTYT
jgi:Matrixin